MNKFIAILLIALLPLALCKSIDVEDDPKSLDSSRVKRAGFSFLTGALQNLPKAAFSASATAVAGGSASSAGSGSSSSSSGHGSGGGYGNYHSHSYVTDDDHHGYENHDTKSFDGWSLKKSILNTLLQAVKAIAGGVTSLKGQLIKGSGYLVSAKGKLISQAGDSVSNAGKGIIKSAHLIPPEHDGGGHNSLGFSLGSKFGGISNSLTKTISGLSSGSAGSVTSLSSSSSSHASNPSGASSSYGGGIDDHHSSVDGHNIAFNTQQYNIPSAVHVQTEYAGPALSYGVPEYHDPRFNGHHEEADDVLSDILRNVPHKPMKSFGYDSGHVVNQFPIPDDPPPFKPLNSYNAPSPFDHYGPPSNSFHSDDHFSDFSNKKTVSVDPNSYNIYHKMTLMGSKPKTNNEPNFVTLPTKILGDISKEGFEIQKSIQYEIKL